MIDFNKHAQLLRELALALAQYDSANPYHDDGPLIARARQAAEEIEAQQSLYLPSDRSRSGRVLAQFGGGEGK